jgi:tetraprenyl-beta-curcumene synthase
MLSNYISYINKRSPARVHAEPPAIFADRRLLARAGLALALANARYWSTVAPHVRAQLAYWRTRADAIPEPALRALALHTLEHEGFAAEVAATLATLTTRRQRTNAIRAIVALEVMYDYLDGLTEQPAPDPLASGRLLFEAFTDALDPAATLEKDHYRHRPGGGDGGYLRELAATVHDALARLPSATALAPTMQRAAARCAEAEVLTHVATLAGGSHARGSGAERWADEPRAAARRVAEHEAAEHWAAEHARGSGLQWREYLAGAASSVLAVHALIAFAGREHTTSAHGAALDRVYLALGVFATMLDSVVDYEHDAANGTLAFIGHYADSATLAERLADVAHYAAAHARHAPAGAHHLMTLTGIAAYYTSAPSAEDEWARPVSSRVQAELRPLIAPTLAVMRAWRIAKRVCTSIPSRAVTAGEHA